MLAKKDKVYLRDGRAPIPENELTSKTMSAIKAKNTKPELKLRKALWDSNIKGYRLHWKKAPGRPDISFPGKKIAIFVNGCFWHRCPHCQPSSPKSHSEFWINKFETNVARDRRKINELAVQGWKVITIWECELKSQLADEVDKIKFILQKQD
jgi:DNA mismatch endonuclease (patch repair protein)